MLAVPMIPSPNPRPRRAYDHRLREQVCRTGIRVLDRHLHIPRSTVATWHKRGPRPVVTVEAFDGLLIAFCERRQARVIVRGLRAATDFENELQIAHANADLDPNVDTVFLPTRTKNGFISASLVREIASHGGDVSRFAPAAVCEALAVKFARPLS